MDVGLLPPHIRAALENPRAALVALDQIECRESLYEFVKRGWHVLHPGEEFQEGWAIRRVCAHLEAVTRGEINRLLINIPPGCTKSMIVNVFWPAWEWGPQGMAHLKYISTAHNKELPIRDMEYCRDLIKSEWYQERWPLAFKRSKDGKQEFANVKQGVRYAGSTTSKLTGRRGHRFIIDDPHSVASAESDAERNTVAFWFTETTPTRFNDPKKPVYVIIMQRLHEQDVSGIVINDLVKQGWVHLCLPMEFEEKYRSHTSVPSPHGEPRKMRRVLDAGDSIPYYVEDEEDGELMWPQDPRAEEGELLWPERYDQQSVDDLKLQFRAWGGTYAEAAQLQQRPVARGGGMFKRDDFQFVDSIDEPTLAVRGWDLAGTKDKKAAFTVGVRMELGLETQNLYVTDVVRIQGTPGEVKALIKLTTQADGHEVIQSIPQDPGQAGKAQVADLVKLLHGYEVHFSLESGDKEVRAGPLAAQVEGHNVFLLRAAWNGPFLAEYGLFPGGAFKDQVDGGSRAYHEILKRFDEPSPIGGSVLIQ